jgi:hypothetical protein
MRSEDGVDVQASWGPSRRSMLLTTLSSRLIGSELLGANATEDHPMKQHEQRVEKPNPDAPAELSRFANRRSLPCHGSALPAAPQAHD